ncbi:MAG: thioredoxin [Candidatus Micrarchaeia archaeon]
MVTELKSADFKKEIAKGYTLVDFWAAWCGPCRMLSPIIDQLSEEMAGKLKFAKVDVDAEGELASEFGIMSIPTVIIFKDGKAVAQKTGAAPKEAMKKWIEDSLAK